MFYLNSWSGIKNSFSILIYIFSLQYNLKIMVVSLLYSLFPVPYGQIIHVTDKENRKLQQTQLNCWVRTQRYTSNCELKKQQK
jgi:hypothetical protein